ncbi:hypothetical protein REPUB_Repub20aG0037600 [Reevesia pubescens]
MQNSGFEPDVVHYSILIDGMCKAGHIKVATKLFHGLSVKGLNPDVYTYTGFLRNNCTSKVMQLLEEMVGKGFSTDASTATLIVDLLLRCSGSIMF